MLDHVWDLAVPNSVPVEDDPGGQLAVDLIVFPEHLGQIGEQVVLELLGRSRVHVGQGHPLGHRLIHRGHDGSHTPTFLGRVVVGVVADHHGVLNKIDQISCLIDNKKQN